MTVVTYSDADVISIVEGYASHSSTGTGSDGLTNPSFSAFNIHGHYSSLLTGDPVVIDIEYNKSGVLDFASVPSDCRVTQVVIRTTRINNVTVNKSSGSTFNLNIDGIKPDVSQSLIESQHGQPDVVINNPTFPHVFSGSNTSGAQITYAGLEQEIIETHDFSSSPLSHAELFAQFSNISLSAKLSSSATSGGSNDISFGPVVNGVGYTAAFELEVTYFVGSYSWYIKPTIKIVNGRPIQIIDESTDIKAIPPGDPIPEGYELYGSVEDFPDGPVYVWWSSPEFWFWFIFSPIIPDDVSDWTSGISPPTCTSCLSLTLGTSDVLVADASGAYRLQVGKRNDTLYVRADPDDIVTEEVMIPPPMAKLGFVP